MKINESVTLIGNDPIAYPKWLNSYRYPGVRMAQFFSTVNHQGLTSCM